MRKSLCDVIVLNTFLFSSFQLKKYYRLLARFTTGNHKAQKSLLGGIECIIDHQSAVLPKIPLILKYLYDCDVLEEEVLLDWSSKPSRKYVSKELNGDIRTKAQPFITWLKEAEEESEDDSDDSDVEIEYDDRARAATLKEQGKVAPTGVSKTTNLKEEEEAEDLDIDAI